MLLDLGQCPVCQGPLSYSAKSCPRCGHPFDKYGDFGGYLVAMEEEWQEKEAEAARIRKQKFSRGLTYFVITSLILVVIILLWYLIQHVSLGSANATSGNRITQVPSPTSSMSLAETTVQRYYDDVNNQNYQSAYMMWDSQQESLADFQKGYSHTKSDTLLFGDIVSQADGTTKVFVTVVATEITSSGGTIQHTYKGYYIVGQRGNTWKILDGTLNPA